MQNLLLREAQPIHKLLPPTRAMFWGVILGSLLLAVVTGSAPLVGISPLLVGGGVVVCAAALLFANAPELALYAALFVMLLPLWILNHDLQSALIMGLVASSLIFWLVQVSFRRRPLVWNGPLVLLLLYYLWAFTSLLWSNNLVYSRQELVQYTLVISITFLVVNQIDSLRRLDGFMQTLALSGWMMIGTGVWVLAVKGYTVGERIKLFDTNENMVSVQLILVIPGVLWSVLRATGLQRRWQMVLSLLFLGLVLMMTALSGSRGGVVALVLLMVLFALTKWTRVWAYWGVASAIVLLLTTPVVFATVAERFADSPADERLGMRDTLWKAGLLLITEHWWTGVGIGMGEYAMPAYINAVSDSDHLYDRSHLPAHNPIIEVGTDLGLPGIALYVGMAISAAGLFWRAYRNARRQQQTAILAYCALVSCMSVAFLSAWIKSGGVDSQIVTFLLFTLWIIPTRLPADQLVLPGQAEA